MKATKHPKFRAILATAGQKRLPELLVRESIHCSRNERQVNSIRIGEF
jgi:hypothetical protein